MEFQLLAIFSAIISPILFIVIAVLSRSPRRIVLFALVAGLAFAVLNVVASYTGWWDYPFTTDRYAPLGFYVPALFLYGGAIVGLLGGWLRRRFGLRSGVVFLLLFALVGAVRDTTYARRFPTLLTLGEGLIPILADFLLWLLLACVAYSVMLLLERTTVRHRAE